MNTPSKVIGVAPQLLVPDVVQAAEYYRDIFGFVIIGYALKPPVYAMVQRDGFQIHFAKAEEFVTNEQLRKETTDLILWVPEIDVFYNELKANNADIVQEIVLRPYGSHEFIVRDCNGYKILIGD
jgi:uncharacterized glyoxalase superfamily protein PhnB